METTVKTGYQKEVVTIIYRITVTNHKKDTGTTSKEWEASYKEYNENKTDQSWRFERGPEELRYQDGQLRSLKPTQKGVCASIRVVWGGVGWGGGAVCVCVWKA